MSMDTIVIDEQIRIPAWVTDVESFLRWSHSPDFPERGRFGYLGGKLWVELSMERLVHNQLKGEFNRVLGGLAKAEISATLTGLARSKGGIYLSDGMLLANLAVELSTAPDGMYLAEDCLRKGRARLQEGDNSLEVLGTPDMTLEIVSQSSEEKDTVLLRRLYWEAGVREYWLVDSRVPEPQLDILRRGSTKYLAVRRQGGWVKSAVFGNEFRLTRRESSLGVSEFTLDVR